MRNRIVMLSAVTRRDRHQVMAEVNEAVLKSGGWIEGHTLLSNIATVFKLELPARAFQSLADRLAALEVRLDEESRQTLLSVVDSAKDPAEDCRVTLNVTFLHDEPDLRRTIPAVPG